MRHMLRRRIGATGCAMTLAFLLATSVHAAHESTNRLVFAPLASLAGSAAAGTGIVDYRGGSATESRWTATFQFDELDPMETYVVAVQGRYGDDGSPEAMEYTSICSFTTDASGSGGCWYYLVVLKHLSIVQLRIGTVAGEAVLQATRTDEPGAITSEPNRYSTVDPFAPGDPSLGTPAATPESTPVID